MKFLDRKYNDFLLFSYIINITSFEIQEINGGVDIFYEYFRLIFFNTVKVFISAQEQLISNNDG
jgi:hypothetical protein